MINRFGFSVLLDLFSVCSCLPVVEWSLYWGCSIFPGNFRYNDAPTDCIKTRINKPEGLWVFSVRDT